MCHINGDRPGSPRYDPQQPEPERQGFDNINLLCPTHHRVIDGDEATYTVDVLRAMKAAHEERFRSTPFAISNAEAIRLAFLGGTTVGAALTEIAKAVAEVVGTLSTTPQAPEPKEPQPTISDLIRSLPRGALGFTATNDLGISLGRIVADIFKAHGWRTTPIVLRDGAHAERDRHDDEDDERDDEDVKAERDWHGGHSCDRSSRRRRRLWQGARPTDGRFEGLSQDTAPLFRRRAE